MFDSDQEHPEFGTNVLQTQTVGEFLRQIAHLLSAITVLNDTIKAPDMRIKQINDLASPSNFVLRCVPVLERTAVSAECYQRRVSAD